MKFETPTPIQAQAIPVALKGGDLVGIAQTGTGKTAAFGIPTIMRLMENPAATALILAPTRELAIQIEGVWRDLTRYMKDMRSAILVGGYSMRPQLQALRQKPRLIIATPGRLIDHLEQRTVNLATVAVLILDEADRMLDMGFAPQLNQIMRHVPKERQTMLFTATWEKETDALAKRYLNQPSRVAVASASKAADTVEQTAVETTVAKKNDTLLDEINRRAGTLLIFTRTKSRTDRVTKFLASYGLSVSRIHGGRSQAQRNAALAGFKSGQIRILVATDIAARGIDVTGIGHVINYDLPNVPEDYVHRIGRTGRAGASGSAVALVTPEERPLWRAITTLLQRGGSNAPKTVAAAAPSGLVRSAPLPQPSRAPQNRPRQYRNPQPQRHQRGEFTRDGRGGGGGGGSSSERKDRPAQSAVTSPRYWR
ncbi:MAG: DEAD/DEAH box helicase [Bdellovibrionales bacterium]|nr:DEAD/DEAH box helicase [Bdellovibrionales bacterium]